MLHPVYVFLVCFSEEELKRLNEALSEDPGFSAVGFNYEQQPPQDYDPSEPTTEDAGRAEQQGHTDQQPLEDQEEEEEEEEEFFVPEELHIPDNMIVVRFLLCIV